LEILGAECFWQGTLLLGISDYMEKMIAGCVEIERLK